MRNLQYITLLFITTSLIFVFQNCSQSFSANGSAQFSSLCKAQPTKYSPFSQNKVQFNKIENTSLQKASPLTQKLSLIVKADCFYRNNSEMTILEQKISLPEEKLNLNKIAIDIQIDPSFSSLDIENELNQNSCIVGMAENLPLQKTQSSISQSVNDPQASQQKHLEFVGYYESLNLQSQITAPVIVAIVDTGVDYNHLDLKNRMWKDANGNFGANFTSTINSDPRDDDGHGTHLAGIIAAEQNNNFGVAGLIGPYVKIMAVKSLSSGGAGTTQSVYNGIQYAIANKADIINLSLEAPGSNPMLEDALIDAVNAGIVVTVAIGNQSDEVRANNLYAPAYIGPALGGVLTVASVDTNTGGLSFFSNYSQTYAEIAGPGSEAPNSTLVGILSAAPNDRWTRIPGTSQAAPMVASAAAMVIGFLKTNSINYTANAIELFLKTDGSAINSSLANQVNNGNIIHLGFLSSNLEYYRDNGMNQLDFTGKGSGNTCILK